MISTRMQPSWHSALLSDTWGLALNISNFTSHPLDINSCTGSSLDSGPARRVPSQPVPRGVAKELADGVYSKVHVPVAGGWVVRRRLR